MKLVIYYILIGLLFTACYDDKGNYDYADINVLEVGLDEIYSVRIASDTIVTIQPRLSQSLQENKDNLEFMWLHSTTNTNFYTIKDCDTVCRTEALKFHVDPEDAKLKYEHYFRLNVYDKLTGLEYPVNTMMKLVKPFDGAWILLHAKDGRTELGTIEYIGENVVETKDAYYKATGKLFRGNPLCLGRVSLSSTYYGSSSVQMFSVMTDIPEEAGVYCQWKQFEHMDSLSRMVYSADAVNFAFDKVEMIDGEGYRGGIMLTNGRFYQTSAAMKLYEPARNKDNFSGDFYISHAAKIADVSLVYDKKGRRFGSMWHMNNSGYPDPNFFDPTKENKVELAALPRTTSDSKDADPRNISPDQEVVYVGAGYNYNQSNASYSYAYAVATKGQDSCFIYEFNVMGMSYGSGNPSFSNYYRLPMPKGLNEGSCFASSAAYSGIIFYSAGNTIYRLDFVQQGGKATPIYTHEGGKVVRMRFARTRSEKDGYKNYEFDLARSLGVAFEMEDGTSDFVILNLAATGSLGESSEHFSAKQVYYEFGKITDFVFL
ncbi:MULTISPECIES: PKD-like family lipoprotein [Odoribacteraceae]|uniref:PKD-like family lipoprotein n=1 Tax=Odoribacteraceae TaxID=1853231 RepID=UPI000E4EE9D9|nr:MULTISPECIES: PKD-like family lipoprotein [Odoribacteraceae]MCQ4874654.1 PKD-like family lipoprotein [Butyricimonas paravirosa]RHR80401.1 hypothetical protein DWW52_05160 [Odoribacter sp. AF15-53]